MLIVYISTLINIPIFIIHYKNDIFHDIYNKKFYNKKLQFKLPGNLKILNFGYKLRNKIHFLPN